MDKSYKRNLLNKFILKSLVFSMLLLRGPKNKMLTGRRDVGPLKEKFGRFMRCLSRYYVCLCGRHTVPNLKADRHTNMKMFTFGSDRENIGSFAKPSLPIV